MESEHASVAFESTNREQQKDLILKSNKAKLKKLRSIKLNKSPSLRSSTITRRPKSHLRDFVVDFPSDDVETESPPYSTSSSQFSALSQKSAPTLKRRSSFKKGVRTLTRMSSKKKKKPATKVSRSTRPENPKSQECDRSLVVSPPSSSKSVKASPRNSEHGFSAIISTDRTRRNLTRKTSLRPLRVSAKTKRSPMIQHVHDPGVVRATCSSALKDSKMGGSVQIQHGEVEPEEEHSAMKVCPFSYCSLHGHRHKSAPPLKRLISIRRRLLKNDRNVKVENCKDKPFCNKVHRGVQTDLVEEVDTWIEAESIESSHSVEEEEEEVKSGDFHTVEGDAEVEEDGLYNSDPAEHCKSGSESLDEIAETRSKSGLASESISELESEQEQPDGEGKENLEPGRGIFRFPPKEPEPDGPNNAAMRMKLKDQKYVKMWRLMYKHAVKEVKTEQQVPERSLSEDDRDKTGDNDSVNESYQNQIDAVNLVQKAFDEILLPEIQDQFQVVGEEENAKEAKTASDFGDEISKQKVSKSWSTLKKIFILKRFVKALDKVKQIQKGATRHLPLQPDPEAKRVNLRRQTSEERKNAEDWMLDYALQQVVSKLDPDQQRRVAMLVKAFDTVLPIPDLTNSPNPSPRLRVESRARADQSVDDEESFSFSSALTRRTVSRGQGTEQELDINNTKRNKDVLCSDQNDSFTDKANLAGDDLSEVKKSNSNTADKPSNLEDKLSSNSSTTESARETQSEKQSYMRLWGFVYMHMMENIPGENDPEGKIPENVKTTTQIFPFRASAEINQKALLRRIEAITLIEKAIDDVILPDNQDSPSSPPDGQSTGSDEEPRANKNIVSVNPGQDNTTSSSSVGLVSTTEKGGPEKKMSRNWSNLKQKILLRRFIKAFDNARKFNPRGPRFLEPQADPEAERVRLKHQEMDERKNAEEWMVDHALQQAVARLTPDRKRKVNLLVQAFEAVKT